jgi:hypothetical protein
VRPTARAFGWIASIGIASFALLVALSGSPSVSLAALAIFFLALGIAGLARTGRFRWWQTALIVLATVAFSALVPALAVVGLVLFAFRHYP